jgi:hypothetical protein
MAVLLSYVVLLLSDDLSARLRADEAGRCHTCRQGVVLVVEGAELRIGCVQCGWWEPMAQYDSTAGPEG